MKSKESVVDLIDTELRRTTSSKKDGVRATTWETANINTPTVRAVGRTILKDLKTNGLDDIDALLEICDALLATKAWPHRTIAFQWSFNFKRQFQPRNFSVFERWVKHYVTGWGICDDLCTHIVGYFILEYLDYIPNVKQGIDSDNPFVRRVTAVSFIYAPRRGKLV